MVELASPIQFDERVQPVKLPSKCNANLTNERVVAIGNGLINFDVSKIVQPLILKQGVFEALPRDVCVKFADYADDPDSIICIVPLGSSAVHMGDSGEHRMHSFFRFFKITK